MKWYTIPLCVSINRVVVKLDGDRVFMEKEPFATTIVRDHVSAINLDDFTELDPKRFMELARTKASQESIASFSRAWTEEFGQSSNPPEDEL